MMEKIKSNEIILIDAHVHFHDCFIENVFFDSAWNNFKNAAGNFNGENFTAVLFLTESSGVNKFKSLKEKRLGENKGHWNFEPTEEKNSIVAVKNQEQKIIIIAGRQIVTKEKLEVLGLGIMNGIGDKKPIREVIDAIKRGGGLAVIPWGVGKWIGGKKRIVNKTLASPGLFIGDNGNRPFFWSNKKIFKEYENKNIRNLSGSDPLPFRSENGRAGSFGFAVEGIVNFEMPFESVLNKLSRERPELFYYGKLERPFRFFRNQILMQIKKKIG